MFNVDRMREQYASNAKQLRKMLDEAKAVAPKKYRGYTVADLEEAVERFDGMANGTLPPGTRKRA